MVSKGKHKFSARKEGLSPIGSGCAKNTGKFENINPVHQKKALGPIRSSSTRNTKKYENKNPGDQRIFLGQSSHNQINPTTKQFLSFESMGSGRESMCFGFDLLPLPMKNTMSITSSKNSMTLPMQEKNIGVVDRRNPLFGFDLLSQLPTCKEKILSISHVP